MGLLESIACGTPVAATNVGMVKDVISDKVSGVIADIINEEAIAKKVEYIIKMSDEQKKDLQKFARKSILKFDWKIVAKEHWEKVYKPLIN
jgi:glycosyltransferase involved in cell wall biosynthesis